MRPSRSHLARKPPSSGAPPMIEPSAVRTVSVASHRPANRRAPYWSDRKQGTGRTVSPMYSRSSPADTPPGTTWATAPSPATGSRGFTDDGSGGFAKLPSVAEDQDHRYYVITVKPSAPRSGQDAEQHGACPAT
ncbi:hypothetical protein GCM10010307_13820 [Streptomyces vastus]|uniref:YbhB/YbcL family Raf kinase inhibitor-like protein n=1 Tax=Streptomyces vastus TaxID=285451 RepID=A0ABP6CTL5_9ACTN